MLGGPGVVHSGPRRLKKSMFEYQAPATLNQANPVQNTWYLILDTTKYVRLYGISVNIEDTNETLECRVTIDGETLGIAANAATHSTNYYAKFLPGAISRVNNLYINEITFPYKAFLLEGHSVKVEVRKTTAAGTGNLTGIVVYGVLKEI